MTNKSSQAVFGAVTFCHQTYAAQKDNPPSQSRK